MQRKDNWSAEDDKVLSSTVLNYIRKSETQLAAFSDVGLKLRRTAAACGFRWNSYLRHKYKSEITSAKMEKLQRKSPARRSVFENQISIDSVIIYLQTLRDDLQASNERIKLLKERIQDVSLQIESRRSELALDFNQNKHALAALLTEATKLGIFEQNKKPAI